MDNRSRAAVALATFAASLAALVPVPAFAVDFLSCVPTSPGATTYSCEVAATCEAAPCGPEGWSAISGEVEVPASFFAPGDGRASAIRATPEIEGTTYTLVNKDVGAQRWAIVRDDASGQVTGNVFEGAGGSSVDFLYCIEPTAGADSVGFGQCFLAPPCGAEGCDVAAWSPIGGSGDLASSFFSPSSGRSSGLQLTSDRQQILINKDLGAQRWTITTLTTLEAEAFPLGVGPTLGNVFEVATPEATIANVLVTNGQIAFAAYEDSVLTARTLRDRARALVDSPSDENLAAARQAWLAAREPYLQTEVYRFRGGPIDAVREDGTIGEEGEGPEGRINAWPLGEALIDYVAEMVDGNPLPESGTPVSGIDGNVIADAASFPVIDADVLAGLNELDGDERNVATGYHAIEFLLWGQDLNQDGSPGFAGRDATPGQRPYTDYLPVDGGCTGGNCDRRGQYLLATCDLLVRDLERVTAAWDPNAGGNHYASFVAGNKVSLAKILEGMGRLGYGELAGERMNVALVANSQEDEHSCFSDNTHRDIHLDALGIWNSNYGRYQRVDGRLVLGPGIDALLRAGGHDDVADALSAALDDTQAKVGVIDQRAKSGVPFDLQIEEGIAEPNIVAAIQALQSQTDHIEDAIEALEVTTGDLRQDTGQF